MTAREFEQRTGRKPQQDDLQRINCKRIGQIGHLQCGWCHDHGVPRWECGKCVQEEIAREFRRFQMPFVPAQESR